MPVISFSYATLERLLGAGAQRPLPDRATVLEALGALGMAPDGPTDKPELAVEALMNRPDLFSVEGVARALRPFLGLAPSPTYAPAAGAFEFVVDPSVVPVRGEVAVALVRRVLLDDEGLTRLIDTQEKLDLTYGRKRARVSIGLHDAGPLKSPIMYKGADPRTTSFKPLAAEGKGPAAAQTLAAILATHPKGKEYAHLLEGQSHYPLLVDAAGQVLSMPPIINGTVTQLTPGTRDVFIDVTGTSRPAVRAACHLLAMLLADRGGTIESVLVSRPGEPAVVEPALVPAKYRVSLDYASGLLGLPLHADEAALALERLGHRALTVPPGRALDVSVPPWRFDILHEADLVEDIAIGLGYGSIPSSLPRRPTIGAEHAKASLRRRLRASLVGLGFLEVMTLTLTAPEGELAAGPATTVALPLSRDHSTLRTALLPSLLGVLAANTHRELPQALFEVGEAVSGSSNRPRLCAVYVGPEASFTRAKGLALALFQDLGLTAEFAPATLPGFTPGRAATARVGTAACGSFGELSPTTLAGHGLVHPAFALEFDLSAL